MMKSIRRGIAVLLAALLIIPNLPAKAEEGVPNGSQAAESVQVNTGNGVYTIVSPAKEIEETEPESVSGDNALADGTGNDAESDEDTPVLNGDAYFAADGSYTIQIPEPDPFFPYEVQFTCGGEVTNQWFMTPDDTVEIGGHIFRIAADFSGTVVTQMTLDVAGKKVIVYPKTKDLEAVEDIPMVYSLLPLEQRSLDVDLRGFTPAELTMVSIDSIFTGENALTDTSCIMSTVSYNDNYIVNQPGDRLNLSGASSWEMIVGAADQLAADNIRYQVYVSQTANTNWLIPTVYIQNEKGSRTEASSVSYNYYSYSNNAYSEDVYGELWVTLPIKEVPDVQATYVSLELNASLFPNTNYHHVRVFEGKFSTAAEAEAATEITDKVWQADMSQENAGYLAARNRAIYMTIVMYDAADQVIGVLPMYYYWSASANYIDASYLYYSQSGYGGFYNTSGVVDSDGVDRKTFYVPTGHKADEAYRLPMTYYQNSTSHNDAVTAAYLGQYASIEEAVAAEATDIKEQLFGTGYTADFSQGVYFSVFVGEDGTEEQEIYHLYHITKETEEGEAGGSTVDLHDGTAVRFYGLADGDGNTVNCYVLNAQEDSYAEYNFLTILVGNDVDVTDLAPRFSTSQGVNLYATGSSSPEISGKSCHNFAEGVVQYTAAAENGKNSKNYWLQIVKVSQGAGSIYINSLADPAARTDGVASIREVMLDGYHSNRHDIVLINMGTEAISALSAEVVSDVVELDAYWTLKGVYDLEGFSGTNKTAADGELANMAKVRLKVKEGVVAGSDISGTLTIKSGDTPLLILTLTGTIGNPCISSTEIPEAVKYVPYGTIIQNNNKYSWNTVSYSMYGGSLPEGMEIRSNGELYGVPRETGEFTFGVYMTNSASQFNNSFKRFTLIVNENTDANVDGATDEGYDVTQRIPNLRLGNISANQLFVSQGVFDQFVDVYLDGQKLEVGRDYAAESGSTRITILSQTLNNDLGEGTHTLGVEFRTPDTGTLKRAAQNFVLSTSPVNSGNNNSNDNGDNSSNNNNSGGNTAGAVTANGGAAGSAGVKDEANAEKTIAVSYVIARGDTLQKIAAKFYGDRNLWRKIYADNANIIRNANRIYPGQVIWIYLTESQETAATTAVSSEQQGLTGEKIYVVQRGDNLWKIAGKIYGNGSQWRTIYEANKKVLRAPDMIYAGQQLIIPIQ